MWTKSMNTVENRDTLQYICASDWHDLTHMHANTHILLHAASVAASVLLCQAPVADSEKQGKCFRDTTWDIDHLAAPAVRLWNGPKIFAWNKWESLSRPALPRPKVYCPRCKLHLALLSSSLVFHCSDTPSLVSAWLWTIFARRLSICLLTVFVIIINITLHRLYRR